MDETLDPNLGLEDLRWLQRLALRLVQDPADADDAVQDTVLAALTRAPRNVRESRGWLAKVLRNVVRERHRGAARRVTREQERGVRDPARSTAEVVEELATHRALVDEVNALAEPYRSTIALRFLRDLSPREIAREQGIPVKTVHTRIERGLAQLRAALDRRYSGYRATWISAVTAIATPVGGSGATGTLVIGGLAVGTMMKVSAAVLVAAACVYFVVRTPEVESPRVAVVEPPADGVEIVSSALVSSPDDPAAGAVHRRPVEPPVGASSVEGTRVLRVILEGISEEDAQGARVTLAGVDRRRDDWPSHLKDSWSCQGLTSEFDLDPFFASVVEATNWDLHVDELEVKVSHPLHLTERTRVPVSRGVELEGGRTLYKARVRLVPGTPHVFWPEFTLDVRDADTREHLEDVELRFVPTAFMGRGQMPGTAPIFTSLGGGSSSPIGLLGGREPDGPEHLAYGVALEPVAGEAPRLIELVQPEEIERGVMVYARAPGYAWGSIVLQVSTGGDRELLLEPGSGLNVQLANVQLERYTALGTDATLWLHRRDPDGIERRVWIQRLDETLVNEGLALEGLKPGEYATSVKMGSGSWTRPVLAREAFSLAAGETRELVLALADAPAPSERTTLGGVVSFPAFGGEEEVRLQLLDERNRYFDAVVDLSLAEMEPVSGALPTWSFRLEDLPVGLYQAQLLPFLKNWMIELPAGGREDLELVVPELAEVLVETVDARTGERVPLEGFSYRNQEVLPDQVRNDRARADCEEPGRFRFWTAPGATSVWPSIPDGLDYGRGSKDLELVPGLQTVRFELEPRYTLRFEFRIDGAALPHEDGIFSGLSKCIRAVDHEGRVNAAKYWLFEATAPGLYEISFEGVGADRFLSIPTRLVEVRAGETTEVIVDLRRK